MAHQSAAHPHTSQQPLGSPYCSDPNCQRCKELRAAQSTIQVRAEKEQRIMNLAEEQIKVLDEESNRLLEQTTAESKMPPSDMAA